VGGSDADSGSRCLLCGVLLSDPRQHRAHLVFDHAWAAKRQRSQRQIVRLSWIPAPMFWALVVVMMYWGVVFAVFGDSAPALAGWWIGVFAYLAFLPVAYEVQRHRRRF
jgi:hypothetical protein